MTARSELNPIDVGLSLTFPLPATSWCLNLRKTQSDSGAVAGRLGPNESSAFFHSVSTSPLATVRLRVYRASQIVALVWLLLACMSADPGSVTCAATRTRASPAGHAAGRSLDSTDPLASTRTTTLVGPETDIDPNQDLDFGCSVSERMPAHNRWNQFAKRRGRHRHPAIPAAWMQRTRSKAPSPPLLLLPPAPAPAPPAPAPPSPPPPLVQQLSARTCRWVHLHFGFI